MERVLKFRDNQHEEDRVARLHGQSHTGGSQTDSGIEQTEDYDDDDSDDEQEQANQTNLSRKAKKEIEKRRRRRAKKKTKASAPAPTAAVPSPPPPPAQSTRKESDKKKKSKKHESDDEDDPNVEIEYVPEDLPIKRGDGYYSHFVKVFENFKLDQNMDGNQEYYYDKYGKKILGPKVLLPRDKTNIDENEDEESDDADEQTDKTKKLNDDEEQNKKKSKKQMKRETRMSVAQLKQLVIRPDVVEMFDVTAKDPKLLVHLKVNKNIFLFFLRLVNYFFYLGNKKYSSSSTSLEC